MSLANATDVALGFNGNPDVYGLGIRVGYYTQAFSVWVANVFAQEEAPFLHSLNLIFMLAMIVGISVFCRVPAQVHAVEPFILLQITYFIAFLGTDYPAIFRRPWRKSAIGHKLLREVLFIGLDGIMAWYAWYGIYRMKPTPGNCGTQVWLWAQADLVQGWIVPFLRAVSIPMVPLRLTRFVIFCCHGVQQRRFNRTMDLAFYRELRENLFNALDSERSLGVSCISHPGSIRSSHPPAICRGPSRPASIVIMVQNADSEPHSVRDRKGEEQLIAGKQLSEKELEAHGVEATDTTSSARNSIRSPPRPSSTLPSFDELHQADVYISDILAKDHLPLRTLLRRLHTIRLRPALFLPLLSCALQTVAVLHHLPTRLLIALDHDTHRTVRPQTFHLVTTLRLAHDPPRRPLGLFILSGCMEWLVCAALAIAIELAIQWNGIRHVQSLGSVGQLIPSSLGGGGPVKVACVALAHRGGDRTIEYRDRDRYAGREGGRWNEIRDTAEVYFALKGARERSEREV